MKKLYLIDGHSLIFRMYYAFLRRPMVNSKGEDTSILFGFTKFLLEFINKEMPTHVAVGFDPPAKTFRHEIYGEYKANRMATPELIKSSLDPLIEIVKALNIPVLMQPGYEADDVLGAMAKKAEKDGYKVFMLTPDKDYGQLISENIFQCKPGKNSGDIEIITPQTIKEQYGIEDPIQVIDILSIWGDASDNVPGVRGIGEVGAKKLISKYGSVENIYEHLEELSEKQQAAFIEAKDHIPLSKKLVTIKTDIDLEVSEEDLRLNLASCPQIRELFNRYEFNSLMKLLPEQDSCDEIDSDQNEKLSYQELSLSEFKSHISETDELSIVFLSKEIDNDSLLSSLILSSPSKREGGKNLVCVIRRFSDISGGGEYSLLKSILEDSRSIKIGYNLKLLYKLLAINNISLNGYLADIELMHYLINPERSHKIETLAGHYLSINLSSVAEKESKPADLFSVFDENEDLSTDNIIRSVVQPALYNKIKEELTSLDMITLYETIEMPLIRVLGEIEREGFKVDVNMLNDYSGGLREEIYEIELNIREVAQDNNLNVSSPKQIGVLLYEKLLLNPKVKKNSKQNYPTDEETLRDLRDKHPVVEKILEYRGLKKLLTTYIEPFPTLISSDGKIHTTFNQSLTATGRLSSVRPNLQNIPIRTERGREIRRAFVPSTPENFILSADYSQIELRLMAAFSEDPVMIQAFKENKDIHTSTAARIFKKSEDEVSKQERNRAKVANFGIIYGISGFGLSQRLDIPRKEANQMIEDYFTSFPDVKLYMERCIEKAKVTGYVETIYGRKRYLADINSKNPVARGLSERNAINAPIQGSAADIIKIAMINVFERLSKEGLKSKMILQVHDELVFDVPPQEVDKMMEIVKQEMERVENMSVKLIAECNYGKNWLEAH